MLDHVHRKLFVELVRDPGRVAHSDSPNAKPYLRVSTRENGGKEIIMTLNVAEKIVEAAQEGNRWWQEVQAAAALHEQRRPARAH
jgi:hypothetical protein